MFRFFEKLPDEILLNIFYRLPSKDLAALSQTEERLNNISQEPKLGFLNLKLLNAIRAFNLKIFYSYEAKRDEHYHIEQPEIYSISSIERNNIKIANNLSEIKNLLSKNANPNSQQFLHEAVFLYFIYKDLELSKSKFHQYHDKSEPDNQLKLIHLLLEYDASLTIYKHLGWEYELVSLRCFNNLWNQLKFGKELSPKQMDNLSPIDYAAKFQHQWPEMFKLLKVNQDQRMLKGITTVLGQFKLFDQQSPQPQLQNQSNLVNEEKSNSAGKCNIF